jgi:Holliday junction resolvase RusA-like endonuclease
VRALRIEGLAMSFTLVTTIRAFGEPKGQPRVRRSMSGGVFTPEAAHSFKESIQLAAIQAGLSGRGLSGPVRVDERFFFSAPKRLAKAVAKGLVPHTTKPDRDNCDKVVLDALTQVGVYRDDKLAFAGVIEKWYASPNTLPGVEISIYAWKED